jgi:hypothetical protein
MDIMPYNGAVSKKSSVKSKKPVLANGLED